MLDINIEVIPNILNTVFSLLFITYINDNKIKNNRMIVVFATLMFLTEIATCFLNIYPLPYIAIYLLQFIIPFLYSIVFFDKLSLFRKIIPVFAYFVSFIITELFSSMITATICKSTLIDAIFASGKVRIIHLLISKIMLFLLISILFLAYKKSLRIIKGKMIYYLLIIFPAISLLSVLTGGLAYKFEIYYISSVAITSLSTLAIYYLIYKVWLNNKIEKEKELYKKMLEMESKRYDDIKQSSHQIRKIRHDIKNMLISVKSEIDNDNINNASTKLDTILDSVGSIGSMVKSENRTIDYIVNAKLSNIENRQIKISGNISDINRIKDVDLSIVLGNILDNAIEATEGVCNAVIDLGFFDKNNYHNIICKNTISQSVLSDNPDLKTKKDEKLYHGFGIQSVKEIISYYNGMIDFYEENNMFCVHIMFPIDIV